MNNLSSATLQTWSVRWSLNCRRNVGMLLLIVLNTAEARLGRMP